MINSTHKVSHDSFKPRESKPVTTISQWYFYKHSWEQHEVCIEEFLTSAVILRTEVWELDFWENCTLRLPPLGMELDWIKYDRRRAG